ncbi:MAG: hypothetical protein LBJ95_00875 [Oscillospiraceae bacterium]|nr:hypothetical protein [Oscillospiraceae bacterium]
MIYHPDDPNHTPPSPESTSAYYKTIQAVDGLHWVRVKDDGTYIGQPLPWKGLILDQANGASVYPLNRP